MTSVLEKTKAEISKWFFETYFNHWVAVGAGKRDEGPEFILQYYSTPMYATVDEPSIAAWLTTDQQVVDLLARQHTQLKQAGYTHTHVPDTKVVVYNPSGGAIEVIWSRRDSDEKEIQRFVVHFEVVRMNGVWKVVGAQARTTQAAHDQDSIDKAWAQH